MPPQQTNVTSDAVSDAARLRLDVSLLSSLIRRCRQAFLSLRRRPTTRLHELNDRQLMDIGLTRGEVDSIAPDRAADRIRERASDLWSRGGL